MRLRPELSFLCVALFAALFLVLALAAGQTSLAMGIGEERGLEKEGEPVASPVAVLHEFSTILEELCADDPNEEKLDSWIGGETMHFLSGLLDDALCRAARIDPEPVPKKEIDPDTPISGVPYDYPCQDWLRSQNARDQFWRWVASELGCNVLREGGGLRVSQILRPEGWLLRLELRGVGSSVFRTPRYCRSRYCFCEDAGSWEIIELGGSSIHSWILEKIRTVEKWREQKRKQDVRP